MGAHGTCNTLFIANLHKMIASLECIPDLETFRQQGRWVMESDYMEL